MAHEKIISSIQPGSHPKNGDERSKEELLQNPAAMLAFGDPNLLQHVDLGICLAVLRRYGPRVRQNKPVTADPLQQGSPQEKMPRLLRKVSKHSS